MMASQAYLTEPCHIGVTVEKSSSVITDKQILEGLGRDKKLKGVYCQDCAVGVIVGPARLERELCAIPGVVGTGLFIGIASVVLVANSDGSITTFERRL